MLPEDFWDRLKREPTTEELSLARHLASEAGWQLDDGSLRRNIRFVLAYGNQRTRCAACPGPANCEEEFYSFTLDDGDPYRRRPGVCVPRRRRFYEDYVASQQALLPKDFRTATLKTWKPETERETAALRAAIALAENPGATRGLGLAGGPGRGKTHLAVGIYVRRLALPLMKPGAPDPTNTDAEFYRLPDLLNELQALAKDGEALADRLEALQRVRLLIIDDLGVGRPTEFRAEQMWSILDGRQGSATVFTSNYTDMAELGAQLDPDPIGAARLMSRLASLCEWHWLDGRDHRLDQEAFSWG